MLCCALRCCCCPSAQDPPQYFDRQGGILAYKAAVPAEMLAAAVPTEEPLTLNGTLGHLRLIHQLLQMRDGPRVLCLPASSELLPRNRLKHVSVHPTTSLSLPLVAFFCTSTVYGKTCNPARNICKLNVNVV